MEKLLNESNMSEFRGLGIRDFWIYYCQGIREYERIRIGNNNIVSLKASRMNASVKYMPLMMD